MKEIVQEAINVLLNSRREALRFFVSRSRLVLFCVSMINGLRVTGRPAVFEIASETPRRMTDTRC